MTHPTKKYLILTYPLNYEKRENMPLTFFFFFKFFFIIPKNIYRKGFLFLVVTTLKDITNHFRKLKVFSQ